MDASHTHNPEAEDEEEAATELLNGRDGNEGRQHVEQVDNDGSDLAVLHTGRAAHRRLIVSSQNRSD
jgi:hypothetical protein